MSGDRHEKSDNTSVFFESLSNEEIERLICDVFFEDDIDNELLACLLDAYDKRGIFDDIDVDAAFKRFRHGIIEQEESGAPEDADDSPQTRKARKGEHNKRRVRALRFSYAAAALIAVAVLLFATPVGASILRSIANWTSEKFWFGDREIIEERSKELITLHNALAEHDVTDIIAPTWLPEGYVLSEFSENSFPARTTIYSHFEDGEKALAVHIVILFESSVHQYEKDENEIEIYTRNGIDHCIMTNNSRVVVLWTTGNYECAISGDISALEAKHMIDSIYG